MGNYYNLNTITCIKDFMCLKDMQRSSRTQGYLCYFQFQNITEKKKKNTLWKQFQKSNIKENGKFNTSNKQLHERSLSSIGSGTSIKSGGINLVLWAHTSLLSLYLIMLLLFKLTFTIFGFSIFLPLSVHDEDYS